MIEIDLNNYSFHIRPIHRSVPRFNGMMENNIGLTWAGTITVPGACAGKHIDFLKVSEVFYSLDFWQKMTRANGYLIRNSLKYSDSKKCFPPRNQASLAGPVKTEVPNFVKHLKIVNLFIYVILCLAKC